MIWNASFVWVLVNLLVVPSLFYLPTLDYLNLPRGVFWIYTSSLFLIFQFWRGNLAPVLKVDRLTSLMLLFLAWSALSSTWAWQSEYTWLRFSFIFLAYVTFCFVRSFSDQQKNAILWMMSVQGAVLAVLGYFQFYEIKPFSEILQTEKPGLTMGHRNVAAEYVLLCMGAALSRIKGFKAWPSYLALLCGVMCLTVILLTRCRGVILGIMLATVCYFIIQSIATKSKFFKVSAILVFIIIAVGGIFVVQAKFPGVQESFSSGKMESIRMRVAHYSNTLVLIKEHLPTGVGLGNFAIQYSQYLNSWVPDKHYSDRLILRNTHSDPLECLAELGPLGFLIAMLVLFMVFFKVDKTSWSQQALWWCLLALVFNSCVNFPFQVIQTQMAVAIILGCFIPRESMGGSWSIELPTRKLFKFALTACLLYNCFHHYQRIEAARYARKGIDFLLSNQPAEAEPLLRKSVELDPRHIDQKMLLAHCLRNLNRATESSSIAENVLGIFPAYLPAYNLIGLNALKINDLNRAVRAFEESYQNQKFQESTKEKLHLSYVKLGIEFRKRGFIKEARELELRLQEIYPDNRDSYQREALDLINMKQVEMAEQVIEKAKSIKNDEKIAFLEARLAALKQNWVGALEALNRGLKIAPQDKKLLLLKSEIQGRFLNPKPKN